MTTQFRDYYVIRHPDGAWSVARARMAKSGRIHLDTEGYRILQPGDLEKAMEAMDEHGYDYADLHG